MFLKIIMFLLISVLSFSEINLTTDNSNPGLNEPFKIIVEFKNMEKEKYELSGLNDFELLYRGTRNSTSWVNGLKTSLKSDIYNVMPSDIGNFDLGVRVKGKLKSNRLRIKVSESSANKNLDKKTNSKINFYTKKLKENYYFGEKIPYYEKIILKTSLRDYGYVETPIFEDFTIKDVTKRDSNGFPLAKRKIENGKEVLELTLSENILEANSTGLKQIKQGKIKVEESTDDFFMFDIGKPLFFGGRKININIMSLPEEEKPDNFQMVVGSLKGNYEWSQDNKIELGESFLLKINLSGNVNLNYLEKIVNKKTDEFNIYESVLDENEDILSGEYSSRKSFEVAFIPKKTGEIKTPEIKIYYFDTKEKRYKYFLIPSKNINVKGNFNDNSFENKNLSTKNQREIIKFKESSENKSLIQKEIMVSSISDEKEEKILNFKNILLALFLFISILESFFIIKWIREKKNNKKEDKNLLKIMLKSKNNKEFYEAYCSYMKFKYNFSPKAQFENILVRNGGNEDIINLNREIENSLYKNLPIDKKSVVFTLKKNK